MATNVNTIKYELQVEDKASATLREIESTIAAIGTSADELVPKLTNAENKLAKLPKLTEGINSLKSGDIAQDSNRNILADAPTATTSAVWPTEKPFWISW